MAGFHTPVLADEVCAALEGPLAPTDAVPEPILVDATCGGGGHTTALIHRARPAQVICFDRDTDALAHASARLRDAPIPVRMVHAPFSRLAEELAERGLTGVSAIVADLGVSSHQLDTAGRGFAFSSDGPLDMRMDQSQGRPAAEVLAELDADGLTRILKEYGEEPDARRIARAIVERRPSTTRELAEVVANAAGRRRSGQRVHPATRTFQAIRMLVNRELEELERFLEAAPELLVVGGRLGVISFHSLEDRRVKRRFRALSQGEQPPPGVPLRADELPKPRFRIPSGYAGGITARASELQRNPRSRSARLRVLERALP